MRLPVSMFTFGAVTISGFCQAIIFYISILHQKGGMGCVLLGGEILAQESSKPCR